MSEEAHFRFDILGSRNSHLVNILQERSVKATGYSTYIGGLWGWSSEVDGAEE